MKADNLFHPVCYAGSVSSPEAACFSSFVGFFLFPQRFRWEMGRIFFGGEGAGK